MNLEMVSSQRKGFQTSCPIRSSAFVDGLRVDDSQ